MGLFGFFLSGVLIGALPSCLQSTVKIIEKERQV